MTTHKTVQGTVVKRYGTNAVKINCGGYGKDMLLSQYGGIDTDVQEGQVIEMAYTEKVKDDKTYNNIVAGSIRVLSPFKPKDITNEYTQAEDLLLLPSSLNKDTLIVRQSCLKAAVEMVCHAEAYKTGVNVLDLAKNFEEWVFR